MSDPLDRLLGAFDRKTNETIDERFAAFKAELDADLNKRFGNAFGFFPWKLVLISWILSTLVLFALGRLT